MFGIGLAIHNLSFNNAVGYDWRKCLQEKAEQIITDETMSNATLLYPPRSKEAMLYRQVYDSWYKDIVNVDKYWMPEETWFETEISDPSALVLECYKTQMKTERFLHALGRLVCILV